MKKIYLSILSLAVAGVSTAQVQSNMLQNKKTLTETSVKPNSNFSNEAKAILWQNSFGTPSEWSFTDNSATPSGDNWVIGTGVPSGSFAIAGIMSTTAADGFALFDSDALCSGDQNADVTFNAPISLVGNANVILQFEAQYREFQGACYVITSTDGTTWTQTQVLQVGSNNSTANPELVSVNVSALIGGSATAYVGFRYIGGCDYAWMVDDVAIVTQPNDDLNMLTAWVSGTNNGGSEYGRTPTDQLDSDFLVGAQVHNFGANAQTNLVMTADFGSWNSTSSAGSLASGDTTIMESTETPALPVGVYDGMYQVTSVNEQPGAPEFGNNTYLRSFEVTNDLYSIDGIGVHPASEQALGSLGTDSFTGGEDGLIAASMYHIKSNMAVEGIEIIFATGTVEGGDINVKFIDTANFLNNDMTAFAQSNVYTLTAADVTAGSVTVFFPSLVTLTPGAYFAAVEMYSNGNNNDIRILDDITVAQPGLASMIFIPGDQSYTNGEALGIRLKRGFVGLDENNLNGVSVYPNPSEGVITISNANNSANEIVIMDVTGKVVYSNTVNASTTVDLSANGTGIYFVKISNENGSIVEKVVIK